MATVLQNQLKRFGKNKSGAGLAALFLAAATFSPGQVEAATPSQPFNRAATPLHMKYSEFIRKVEDDRINKVRLTGNVIVGKVDNEDNYFRTVVPSQDIDAYRRLEDNGVEVDVVDYRRTNPSNNASDGGSGGFFRFVMLGLLIAAVVMVVRKTRENGGPGGGGGIGGGGGPMAFTKSKAKKVDPDSGETKTFDDVAGADDAKEKLLDVIEFLKNPGRLQSLGGQVPVGTLLEGPPGTGKTLLAKAVAGEAGGVPFFTISGSDFVEMYVGVGASRVRDMFRQARENAPCILFIDEIDAIGKKRGGTGLNGSHDEREQTLNQILVEMDGFKKGGDVIVLAATNRMGMLDPALLRPGRFNRKITVGTPDVKARKEILEVHTRGTPLGADVVFSKIAEGIAGFSGADIENLVNEAALVAAKRGKTLVEMEDFEDAKNKILESEAGVDWEDFGKSKLTFTGSDKDRKTFADVAGVESAKEDLQDVIDFLKSPEQLQSLGGRAPKGTLLEGPPGTGKTLLAKAVAGEAGVPFFNVAGSDFVEKYVGEGASRVRDLFAEAKKQSPCILFIDEIDAVGKKRSGGMGNDEREQTLNQILVEMDGFKDDEKVVVIGATNRTDVLDPALLRPGRFDRKVVVSLPDMKSREKILEVHMKDKPMASDISVLRIARGTTGFSGADLANLVNEMAVLAAKQGKSQIEMADFEEAHDKIRMGAPRDSLIMDDEEKERTAWHEAGHALVTVLAEHSKTPIYKATIMPRGQALGMVMRVGDKDLVAYTLGQLKAEMAIAYGGRCAELIYADGDGNSVTTGASNDIQQATNIVTKMVKEWGYSEKLGVVRYNEAEQGGNHLGGGSRQREISEGTAKLIDEEIRNFTNEANKTARDILEKHHDQLKMLANALLKYETLSGDEILDIIDGKPLARSVDVSGNDNKEQDKGLKPDTPAPA